MVPLVQPWLQAKPYPYVLTSDVCRAGSSTPRLWKLIAPYYGQLCIKAL